MYLRTYVRDSRPCLHHTSTVPISHRNPFLQTPQPNPILSSFSSQFHKMRHLSVAPALRQFYLSSSRNAAPTLKHHRSIHSVPAPRAFRSPLTSPARESTLKVFAIVPRRLLSTLRPLPLRRSRPSPLVIRLHHRPISTLQPRLRPRPKMALISMLNRVSISPALLTVGGLSRAADAVAGIRGMKVLSSVKKRCDGCRVRFFPLFGSCSYSCS